MRISGPMTGAVNVRRTAWLWAPVLAAALLVPAVPWLTSPARSSVLDVTLTGTKPGTVELFYDVGRGYNGFDMSHATIAAGERECLSLSLPDGEYPRFRLDPTTCADEVTIESLTVRHVATGTRQIIPLSALRAVQDVGEIRLDGNRATVISDGVDPILFVEPAEPLRVGSGVRPWVTARLSGAFLATTAAIGGVGTAGVAFLRRRSAATRQTACLAALACLLAAPRLVGLNQPLLDFHAFRQTQTALTAYWFTVDGVTLPAYPLPVLGRPWTAPFEFPTYQLAAAAVHRLGVPLDAACRGTALVAFVAAVVSLVRLVVRHDAPWLVAAFIGVFALATPFALVWSKAALIEFTAVWCAVVFVGAAAAANERGFGVVRWPLLLVAGTAAALTKLTTFAVFWPAAALLASDRVWHARRRGVDGRRLVAEAVAWGLVLTIPLAAGQAWAVVTDAVKSSTEATVPLTLANVRDWTHGTLAQRLDYRTWRAIARRIGSDVLPWLWPVAVYGLFALRRLPRRIALVGYGTLAGACGVVAVFFNLYVVHDYYLCAIVVPLWLAAAAGLWGVTERIPVQWARRLVLPATLMLMIVAASRSFMVRMSYDRAPDDGMLDFCREVQRVVPPDRELVIVGDDWNPRVPYYARRKAFMVWRVLPDELVRDYVSSRGVRDLVVRRTGDTAALNLLPGSDFVLRHGDFELRTLNARDP